MPAKPDRDSSSNLLLPGDRAAPTGLSIIRPPAKCELDTDRFLPQSGFLLDKQDPGQAHNPSSKLVMWLLTEIYFDLPFFEF